MQAFSLFQVLKYYAWELAFGDKVLDIWVKEMALLKKRKLLAIISQVVWGIAPFLVRAFVCMSAFVSVCGSVFPESYVRLYIRLSVIIFFSTKPVCILYLDI